MARIRTIKPEFFTSEDIVSLSPLARLLYIALWCEADKEGRLVWKPMTFKLRYLPGDSININELCDELLELKLVVLYGDGYAYIPAFKAHQHINPRETESQLPEHDASPTRQSRVTVRANLDVHPQGGREGKGKIYIPVDFSVSDRVKKWAEEKGFENLDQHLEHFIGVAKKQGYKYADWDSAFMEAIRKNWAGLQAKAKNGVVL